MKINNYLKPRDIVKLAFQYKETEHIPYNIELTKNQQRTLSDYYKNSEWKSEMLDYIGFIASVDTFLGLGKITNDTNESGFIDLSRLIDNQILEDAFGCKWQMGSTYHQLSFPLHEPTLKNYKLPDLKPYFEEQLIPRWPEDIKRTRSQFRMIMHVSGLFERAWSLRSFNNLLMDMVTNKKFIEELLDYITRWMIESIDLMSRAPVDAIFFTDDHAGQRGMLMGAERWRKFFKPCWKKIYERVHHYGLYTIMHMCGDNREVMEDLIEIVLDCAESCQPEAQNNYILKKKYGKDIIFWGGLGVQSTFTFGTSNEVREETKRLKEKMGSGGGYILSSAKPPLEDTPIENIAAFLQEANKPVS